MPIWKIELIPEAHADFKELDGSVKKQVLKQLIKIIAIDKREDMEVWNIRILKLLLLIDGMRHTI